MAYNTQNTPNFSYPQVDLDSLQNVSPVWAQILFKGISKRHKLKKGAKELKKDPSLLFKGLLGKSLLDKHINPFFRRMLPDSLELDVLKQQMRFSPNNKFDMTLGKRGATAKLGFDWRC